MSEISEMNSNLSTGDPSPAQQVFGNAQMPDTSAKLADLKDKASDDLTQLRQAAEDQANAALDATTEKVTEQKDFLAGQFSGVATAFEKAGAELERGDQKAIGRYVRELASSAKGIAENVRGRDLGEVASMAEDFGRKQPVAFLGLAALAGFAASRFVTASAQRRSPPPPGASTTAGRSTGDVSNANRGGHYNG